MVKKISLFSPTHSEFPNGSVHHKRLGVLYDIGEYEVDHPGGGGTSSSSPRYWICSGEGKGGDRWGHITTTGRLAFGKCLMVLHKKSHSKSFGTTHPVVALVGP